MELLLTPGGLDLHINFVFAFFYEPVVVLEMEIHLLTKLRGETKEGFPQLFQVQSLKLRGRSRSFDIGRYH